MTIIAARRPGTPTGTLSIVVLASAALTLSAAAVVLPAATAGPLIILAILFSTALLEPKLGYVALAITVPWGSQAQLTIRSIPVTPTDVVVAGILMVWGLKCASERRIDLTLTPWLLSLTMLLITMLLSSTQSASLTLSLRELTKWTEALVATLLAPVFLRSRRDVWLVVGALIASGVSEAVLGLVQFSTHAGPRSFEVDRLFLRAYGTFGQPNPFAGYLNMILPLAASAALALRRPWAVVSTMLIATASFATLSRAGWVAGLLALLVVWGFYAPRLRPWLVLTPVAGLFLSLLALFGLLPASPFARVAASFDLTAVNFHRYNASNFSEVERVAHWVAGLRMFAAHPILGVGIGNYPAVYGAYHVGHFVQPLGHAHDYFINIAAEAGIFGLLAYGLVVCLGMWTSARLARTAPNGSLAQILGVGMVGIWVASTFHNLFDVLYVHELPVLLGLLMGTLTAVALGPQPNGRQGPRYHTGEETRRSIGSAMPPAPQNLDH